MRRLALTILAFALLTLATSAHAAFPGKNGKIAFMRSQLNMSPPTIFTMEPDGSGIAQLPTGNLPRANFPAWSPDGTKIAFTGGASGDRTDIYVENADGSGQTRLTDDAAGNAYPGWSPDGSKLIFTRPDAGGIAQINVMNADGSGKTALTNNPRSSGFPVWSPDGSRIAFMREVIFEGNSREELFVMNSDGTGEKGLSSPGFYSDAGPDWSPDGSRIVFFSNRNEGGSRTDVYVMNADGSAQTRLTADAPSSGEPAWSPDGTKIVYAGGFDVRTHRAEDIYVMNPDGTGKANLTNAQPEEINALPDWQPLPGPRRGDYKNAAQFCQADRDFLGDEAFGTKYGTNGNGANAFGKCVSQNADNTLFMDEGIFAP